MKKLRIITIIIFVTCLVNSAFSQTILKEQLLVQLDKKMNVIGNMGIFSTTGQENYPTPVVEITDIPGDGFITRVNYVLTKYSYAFEKEWEVDLGIKRKVLGLPDGAVVGNEDVVYFFDYENLPPIMRNFYIVKIENGKITKTIQHDIKIRTTKLINSFVDEDGALNMIIYNGENQSGTFSTGPINEAYERIIINRSDLSMERVPVNLKSIKVPKNEYGLFHYAWKELAQFGNRHLLLKLYGDNKGEQIFKTCEIKNNGSVSDLTNYSFSEIKEYSWSIPVCVFDSVFNEFYALGLIYDGDKGIAKIQVSNATLTSALKK